MKNYLSALATLLLLAGCDTADPFVDEPERVPIRFRSGIEAHSRAHEGMDTRFPADRPVAFWVDRAATGEQLYGNNVLTTDGRDGFTGGLPMYFPQAGDPVAVYAMHTNASLAEPFPATAIVHTVAEDQTSAAAYYDSDLLYAVNASAAADASGVGMTFYHLLSKVRVALVAGTPDTDFAGAKLEIVGCDRSVDFAPSKSVDMVRREQRATMVAPAGNAGDVRIGCESSADFTVANVRYNDAVVVPQTVAAGTAFIRLTFADRTVLEWKPTSALELESGKRYTYEVTASRTGLKVSAAVSGWEDTTEEIDIMFESNCYMVEPDSKAILIPVSIANRAADPRCNLGANGTGLGGVTWNNYTVETVWSDAPLGVVVRDMRPLGGYVYVKPGSAGNAVVCIKVDGKIKWSWHIWVTEPVGSATDVENGTVWMDRNLGATSATPYVDGVIDETLWKKTLGVYCQWGRKDILPPKNTVYYTPAGGDVPFETGEGDDFYAAGINIQMTELYQLVENPFIMARTREYIGSTGRADAWGITKTKTMYDPCPPGWKIPSPESWSSNKTDWELVDIYGLIYNGVNGTSNFNQFYPSAKQYGASPSMGFSNGHYHSWSLLSINYSFTPGASSIGLLFMIDRTEYRSANSVRCVAE